MKHRVKIKLKKPKYNRVFLSIGSNMGNSAQIIDLCYLSLKKLGFPGRSLIASSTYKTSPWGTNIAQNDFLNSVVIIKTLIPPLFLLHQLHKIEQHFGRIRATKYGPRTLDIDILFFDNIILNSESLTIPHPLLSERAFVLQPLSEIAPFKNHPTLKQSVKKLLHNCKDPHTVKRV